MDIAIVSYQRFADMPRDVYNECCRMGFAGSGWNHGELRDLARGITSSRTGRRKHRLRSALIMYAGETIVGWAAFYDTDYGYRPSVSVWVKERHRGKGYGTMLGTEAFRRWGAKNPEVYRSIELLWDRLRNQISPNASVTMASYIQGYASQSRTYPTQ